MYTFTASDILTSMETLIFFVAKIVKQSHNQFHSCKGIYKTAVILFPMLRGPTNRLLLFVFSSSQ